MKTIPCILNPVCGICFTCISCIIGYTCLVLGCNETICLMQDYVQGEVLENSQFIKEECSSSTCVSHDTYGKCTQETLSTYDCSYWTTGLLLSNNQTCHIRGQFMQNQTMPIFYNRFTEECSNEIGGIKDLANVGISLIFLSGVSMMITLIYVLSKI